jgi:energy-coupling factor transporter ATP-binding protein EcfA2
MKYRDLVQFEPITSVIQLKDANEFSKAQRLVETYVISEQMADKLISIVFRHLQFDEPTDNKALLIVGNYGSGKSHLMSVVSAVAEHRTLAAYLTNDDVAQGAEDIAGKFKVIRLELGSTTMALRDAIVGTLQEQLSRMGVDYVFPSAADVVNHKSAFEDMMSAYHQVYPEHGLLMVVDELLDYLYSRDDMQKVRDLGFLREIGEACKDLRFRFIAGVQEAIFESPRFASVGDSLRRVKDRFEQVLIVREDVKFVVSERLLKKTTVQEAKIAAHLKPFAKFYGDMNERMDEFIHLFPVHPDYIDTVEKVSVAEKRHILKTLSLSIEKLLEQKVPQDHPGLIAYDSYWTTLMEDSSYRNVENIRIVSDRSRVLEDKIDRMTRKNYQTMAKRIIHGLSVHRLTVGDIHSPIGLTPEELRDTLCLYEPEIAGFGGEPAEDLAGHVGTVLDEIRRMVSGQFISFNPDNRQYYLDLDKHYDYDADIENETGSIGPVHLNRYYYEALKRLMECADQTYVNGFRIWEHELEWLECKAARLGYLFFGCPNERSTVAPPREFYLYFIQPYEAPRFKNENKPDEVFLYLEPDEVFDETLRYYAAASELANRSSGSTKVVFEEKADGLLGDLANWLRENFTEVYKITYQGSTRKLSTWLRQQHVPRSEVVNIRDVVNTVSSGCLAPHFRDRAPEYPSFKTLITSQNRPQAMRDALRAIAGGTRTKQATDVLQALELMDGERIDPRNSRYARHILSILEEKSGQVINRSELIEDVYGVDYFAPNLFRLEPEWLIVVIVALVYSGHLVLVTSRQKIDATQLAMLPQLSDEELLSFRHVAPPKDWNLLAMQALMELLGLAPGLAVGITQRDNQAVQQVQAKIDTMLSDLVKGLEYLKGGLHFWSKDLLAAEEENRVRAELTKTKTFLETIRRYSTPAKFQNFAHDEQQIEEYKVGLRELEKLENLRKVTSELDPLVNYFVAVEVILPEDHDFITSIRDLHENLHSQLSSNKWQEAGFSSSAKRQLKGLQDSYIDMYLKDHQQARLDVGQDKQKTELSRDPRLKAVRSLAPIKVMNRGQLTDFENTLNNLKTCPALTRKDLQSRPKCPHCGYLPGTSQTNAAKVLEALEMDLEQLYNQWTKQLLGELNDPTVKDNFDLLKPEQRKLIEDFLDNGSLPEETDDEFVLAIQELLDGLIPVSIDVEQLHQYLFVPGTPLTCTELKNRFDEYLNDLLKGKERDQVRIVLK